MLVIAVSVGTGFGGDRSDWVYDRIILAKCNNTIPKESQDKGLLEKMCAECEAVINMLIQYIKDFIKNGYEFHIPEECMIAREEYKRENSLVKAFLEECTEPRQYNDSCTCKKAYDVFKAWCSDSARGYYTY